MTVLEKSEVMVKIMLDEPGDIENIVKNGGWISTPERNTILIEIDVFLKVIKSTEGLSEISKNFK